MCQTRRDQHDGDSGVPHTAAVNALQCVKPADISTMGFQVCLTGLRVETLTHLRKLGLCILDLVLKLLQIHRNLDDVLVLHHVPHNAPE